MFIRSLLLITILMICGCVGQQPVAQQSPPSHAEATGLVLSINAMTAELISNLEDSDPLVGDLGDGLLVTTFVESRQMTRTSSFGRYLADQLMNEFQRQAVKVIEIRKSNAIRVEEKHGEFGLAREEKEIRDELQAGAMLTGTYLVGHDDILVTARIIDNRTAALLASSTVIFPKNSLTSLMLADSSSVRRHGPQPLYMKRVEL